MRDLFFLFEMESEPSLCNLLLHLTMKLTERPSEHTTKHFSNTERLPVGQLQWSQWYQPTNPVGTTYVTVLVQLLRTHWHLFNFSCSTLEGRGTIDVLVDGQPWRRGLTKPPVLQFHWVILTCRPSLPFVQHQFFYLYICNHRENGFKL